MEYICHLGFVQACQGTFSFPVWWRRLLNIAPKTGFLLVADTNVAPGQSAIEEVPVIALHQHLFPNDSEATLLKFPDAVATAGWDTTWYVISVIAKFPILTYHSQD